jgi:mannose-6-phosphate isomerase-like protein (cupin superfamily)
MRSNRVPFDDPTDVEVAVDGAFAAIHSALGGTVYRDALIAREVLHLPGLVSGLEAGLPRLTDIELALEQDAFLPGDLRVQAGRQAVDKEQLRIVNRGKIEPEMLASAARLGNALVFGNVQKRIPKAFQLARRLENWLGDAVEFVMFASFGPDSGYLVHHDQMHVLIVQLEGAKVWTLHGAPVSPGLLVEMQQEPEPAREVKMNSGDVLYLPAGQRHFCHPEGFSVHLAIVILGVTGRVIRRKLEQEMTDSALLNEPAPAILGADGDGLAAEAWRAHMHELVDQLDIAKILAAERKRRRIRARVNLEPRTRQS